MNTEKNNHELRLKLAYERMLKSIPERETKYKLLQEFEVKHLESDFNTCLRKGFSFENPKIKYKNYLRYHFLHFAFTNQISTNDLNLLAVQKNNVGLIYYSVYRNALLMEEVHDWEIINEFLKSYVSLQQISEYPEDDMRFFIQRTLIKPSAKKFFEDVLKNYDKHYKGFAGTFNILNEPYFHFQYKTF